MLEDFFELFTRQIKAIQTDAFGAAYEFYSDGETFQAGIATANSNEVQLAERRGLHVTHTLTFRTDTVLHQNDRIVRVKDGTQFRVTSDSDDMTTPAPAVEKYSVVYLEVFK